MERTVEPVKVHILDKEFLIACPEDEKNDLMKSAAYLDRRMREVRKSGKVVGADRIAVMVALNITHEMLQTTEDGADISQLVQDRIQTMSQRIASVLPTKE
ncbi:cell division protein ZapA [Methylonatrum kenyense]|uniref:cell division protein ZapA n=1 Tax=Methylonatrum kenyense TaxID=455253 RepID=UPI0020BEA995|nr:cell division protein ZapA [Methylonatrum kenyense]MCK8516585.1 cell division protein ZapA [Methylonatrum kenyense]